MTLISRAPVKSNISATTTSVDPISPWIRSIEAAVSGRIYTPIINSGSGGTEDFIELLSQCFNTFKMNPRYQNDFRFLKICFLYIDCSPDHVSIFREMDQNRLFFHDTVLYETFALFLEVKGMLIEAHSVYQLGISRKPEPLERLKKAHSLFLERMQEIVNACSLQKMDKSASSENGENFVNPWLTSIVTDLLRQMNAQLSRYEGYHSNNKPYSGKVALSSLQKSGRNKIIDIGGNKYQIKGCAGRGGFAQVYKAYENSNPDDVVALKIQKPPFPWEFYLYRQLDARIPVKERLNYGFAHRLHLYSDYSILVSDFLAHGTLQDAINSNVVIGGSMDEVLCIYYTIEMLAMLETLHRTRILHGDFKPDNLLIRYSRGDLKEDDFRDRSGPWREQGLCLVDWGRGIDLSLFPENIKFTGDCRTSGFRCIQIQEKKPWTFQVDTYGLCVIVHMMLHNTYMEIEKIESPNDGYIYQPKSTFKRYWQVDLWKNLFTKLLNHNPGDDHIKELLNLRESFQDYMCSNPQLIRKLQQSLARQRVSLCSS